MRIAGFFADRQLVPCLQYFLKHVQKEVISFVVGTITWIKVVPILVINWNPAIFRIAVIQIVVAPLLSLEVLGIIDIGVVIKPIPVCRLSTTSRHCIGRRKSRRGQPNHKQEHPCEHETPHHHSSLLASQ